MHRRGSPPTKPKGRPAAPTAGSAAPTVRSAFVVFGGVLARNSTRHSGFHWLPNRSGIADYADDLRTHGRPLLDVLVEPRTLARGQIREEGVRKLVDELLAGRRRNTRPLGMLLTLELFQRQFIDALAKGDD